MNNVAKGITAAATTLALAQGAQAHEAVATVVAVQPITEYVNQPAQQCWTENRQVVQSAPQRNYLGAILGGVAGGLLGSQVGKGNGRVAGAAIGAGIGAVTGHAIGNRNAGTVATTQPVQRCRTVDSFHTVTTGYHVTYEYAGQRYSTRLPYDPGNTLRVDVAVTPR